MTLWQEIISFCPLLKPRSNKNVLKGNGNMLNKALDLALSIIVAGVLSVSAAAAASLEYIHSALEETYVSEFSLYEQILNNQIVFYTSVSNGAVLTGSVVVELPANLEATLEKDGVECEFTNKMPISGVGSYSLTVIANGSEMLGGNANERYYGLFRFRIMEDTYLSADEWEEIPEVSVAAPTETTDVQNVSGSSAVGTTTTDTSEAPVQTAQNTTAATTGSTVQPSPATPTEKPVAPQGDPAQIKAVGEAESIRLVTRAGTQIYTNVPKNASTSGAVHFTFTSDVEYELYFNGVLKSYSSDEALTEPGEYRLLICDSSSGIPAQFDFKIIGSYVRGVTAFEVPSGCVINSATFDDYAIRSNGASVDLGLEGTYSINISYGEYNYTEIITLDNTPPQFTLNGVAYNADSYASDGTLLPPGGVAKGGPVRLVYISDDIANYQVYLEGAPISSNGVMTEYGSYVIRVYDHAGNYSDQTFELVYVMDGMAILAIAVLAALIIAAVVFIIVSRKRLIIR